MLNIFRSILSATAKRSPRQLTFGGMGTAKYSKVWGAGWRGRAAKQKAAIEGVRDEIREGAGALSYARHLAQAPRMAGPGRIQSFAREAAWGGVKAVGLYTFGNFISKSGQQIEEAYGGVIGGVAQMGGFVVGGGFKLAGFRAGGRGVLRGLHRSTLSNYTIRQGMTGPVGAAGTSQRMWGPAPGKPYSAYRSTSGYVSRPNRSPGVMVDQLGAVYRTADPTGRTVMTSAQAMRQGLVGKKNYAGKVTGQLLSGYENWLYHKPRALFYGSYSRGKNKGKRVYRMSKDGNPQSRLARVLMNTPQPIRGVAGSAAIAGRAGLLVGKGLYAAAKLPLKMAYGAAELAYAGVAGTISGGMSSGGTGVIGQVMRAKHPIAGAFGLGGAYAMTSTALTTSDERRRGWTGAGPHGTDPVMQILGSPDTGIRQRNYGGGITFANNTGRRRITLGSEAVAQRMAFRGRA